MSDPASLSRVAFVLVTAAFVASTAGARASVIPYQDPGTVNQQTYNFAALTSGDLTVWFAGKGTAQNDDVLTAIINGTPIGTIGLDNQTSAIGQELDLGHVNAGDSIIFEVQDLSSGKNWFSDNSKNGDGLNHAYMAAFGGGTVGASIVPTSYYFGFEDVSGCASDWNYQDFQFYSAISAVPEASTWAMLLLGFAGVGAISFRRRRPMALQIAEA